MARITVEDCLKLIPNRFELVVVAAKRARRLEEGDEALLDWEGDKSTVMALREIAEGMIGTQILENTPNRDSTITTLDPKHSETSDEGASGEAV